ncbi:hypothetical protein, partial [Bradyrhizobium liaoningense]|uniref:hypothetical protein n=1 Tax=Bradyrhizobium liaoningense TaxID=43992 RepID=UPI001AEC25FD
MRSIQVEVPCAFSRLTARIVAVLMGTTMLQPIAAIAADPTDLAISGLEFGGSVGKLLWVSVDGKRYERPT